ncbi:hypothetical protein GB937_002771 [Aspergillus fischeri]|nr:hypothetical protein GB937_002771 [Aspergillus fischeri]
MVDGPALDRAVFIFDHQDQIILNEKGCGIAPLGFLRSSIKQGVIGTVRGSVVQGSTFQPKDLGITLDVLLIDPKAGMPHNSIVHLPHMAVEVLLHLGLLDFVVLNEV